MNMHTIDWVIVFGLLATLLMGAAYTARYTNSVSAFLAANRCGRRYIIAMANAMAGVGVITLVNYFEMRFETGFTGFWWDSLSEPALIVIALSGWTIYRFRQTRAMTLAQFFEMRYSRNFRVFAGLVAFIAGIVNFGIYPQVGAHFFMALCGFPETFLFLGFECSTFICLMLFMLGTAIVFTFLGGQIAIMVTDFIQGAFVNLVFVILIAFLLGWAFSWDQIAETMLKAPEGKSLVNPFHMEKQADFNVPYYLIAVFIVFYGFISWQGTQGYNCCAANAHEAKMAGVLWGWRWRLLLTVTIIVPIAVITLQKHPDFAVQATELQQSLDSISADSDRELATLQNRMRTPFALALLLPPGLLGLVCAAMMAAFISTNDSYMHSWGSIFIQDVVLPFRKKPLSPRQHLWMLRFSILGVAIFIFIASLLIRPTQYIAMFFSITSAVFVGGAGAAIIGGLYWKRGTAYGAWAAMISGAILAVTGVVVKQADLTSLEPLMEQGNSFARLLLFLRDDVTGQEMNLYSMLTAIGLYVGVSLFGPRNVTNMDRLLHRGQYAIEGESVPNMDEPKTWLERLGIDREFTKGDRWVAYISVGWPLIWTIVLIVLSIWNLKVDVTDHWWLSFWRIMTWVLTGGALMVTIWFTIGGLFDMRFLFKHLKTHRADDTDDGRVERDS
ncbi:MAG: sodium:solute symporter [Planctomycetota bacterium]|nr:sodium:solute symporter [Planctomycetota bacterium]